jgi:AraC family transcriptional regulator of adaptative response / DNA-3-methyladenine glycosylase II
MIAQGVVEDVGVSGLADRLAVGERHLRRMFRDELGATVVQVARSRRAHLAERLLEDSELPSTEVAFMAGFRSVRAYHETMQAVFGRSPTELRRSVSAPPAQPGFKLRLTYRPPYDWTAMLHILAQTQIPGVEEVTDTSYRRVVVVADHSPQVLEVRLDPEGPWLWMTLTGNPSTAIHNLVQSVRRLFDLDADPAAITSVLAADPFLAPLVTDHPGVRVPGALDSFEAAVLAIVAQRRSSRGAAVAAGKLAVAFGTPLPVRVGTLTHAFPTIEQAKWANLEDAGLSARTALALKRLVDAHLSGSVRFDGSGDLHTTARALAEIPGVGPSAVSRILMRAFRDPDVFPGTRTGLHDAAARQGFDGDYATLKKRAESWRPWRAYGASHLWHASVVTATGASVGVTRPW